MQLRSCGLSMNINDFIPPLSFWWKWKEGWGWAHPPALATLGKMALGASVALGSLTSSVSRRVAKLTICHYLAPLPLQKRGYGDEIQNPVVFMIPKHWSGSGTGGRGMHNGCDFLN